MTEGSGDREGARGWLKFGMSTEPGGLEVSG